MKKAYIEPVATVNEFKVADKLASLNDWLNGDGAQVGVEGLSVDNGTTSYYLAS